MVNLFFPYYSCGDNDRQKEIDLCLTKNINNTLIDKVVIIIDDDAIPPLVNEKVLIHRINQRPTYRLWIEMTKQLSLSGISILCNSDIYFDESLAQIDSVIAEPDQFLALSRWELENDSIYLHKNPHWSQDVWAVHADADFSKEMLASLDFPLGVPRCDNKIAYIFAIRGWRIYNPCHLLRSIHVHETQLRTYHKKLDDRILGGTAYVHPGDRLEDEASLEIDIWTKRSNSLKKVKINKTFEKWTNEKHKEDSFKSKIQTIKENLVPASALEAIDAHKNGKSLYSKNVNFNIIENNGFVIFNNLYTPLVKLKIDSNIFKRKPEICRIAGLIPPVIDSFISSIGIKPRTPEDINFWQYPCATEKQAYENHKHIGRHEHLDLKDKIIHTYVALPWATYIDKKAFPDAYLSRIKNLIAFYKEIAKDSDFTLKVHSVCQHIHWIRILEKCEQLGITDIHLSHKDSTSETKQAEIGTQMSLHGWPLIAVNYEIPERRHGLERKPINERTLLASFVGAHMKHYRDNSRLELFEAAKAYGSDDVLVDLGKEWHFNKIVYEEQVLNKSVSTEHLDEHQQKTFRYNNILSNSKFSLCPEGAGPNTLRLWESIAVGSIPIIFSDDVSIFSEDETGKEILKNILIWNKTIDSNLFYFLSNIDPTEAQEKSEQLIKLYTSISSKKTIA